MFSADNNGYAIIDFETTGLSPKTERVVEFGVVLADPFGRMQAKFASLVNPQKPIPAGAQKVHGISDEEVQNAPLFGEVASDFKQKIGNRLLVAHNARFDRSFLFMELQKAHLLSPHVSADTDIPFLCTMEMSKHYMPHSPSKSLAKLTQDANIPLDNAHRALNDATATALLLQHFISSHRQHASAHALPWQNLFAQSSSFSGWLEQPNE